MPAIILFGGLKASETVNLSNFERIQRIHMEREKHDLEKKQMEEQRKLLELKAKNSFIQVPDFNHLPQQFPIEIDLNKDVAFVRQGSQFIYCHGGRYIFNHYRQYPEWHQYVRPSRLPDWKELTQ
jgi:hypothetical protein